VSTPAELPPLAFTALCANQAFARGPNVLALQFHLEAESASFERWLVGHSLELGARSVSIAGLREDASAYAGGRNREAIPERNRGSCLQTRDLEG
jgi:GMP synthase (glutamine-hydrolysing)